MASAAVAGAVAVAAVAPAVAPSGLCSEDVFAAGPASDPALAPSFSVDVVEGPFALAMMSKISKTEDNAPLAGIYHQSISEVVNQKSKHARTGISKPTHTGTLHTLHKH